MASSPSVTATFCATLVDEWVRMGLRTAIVSPGSRSTPMALALVARRELNVQVFHDERSAAFAALGVGLASGLPAILLCTSGTAAVEFHPAVVEAHEARVPMLVCTADRPPELQGVGAPQTIDQRNLYGSSVRLFIEPGVADDVEVASWRPLAQRALASSLGVDAGPVHLNLAFREPLVGTPLVLPEPTPSVPATSLGPPDDAEVAWVSACCEGARGVIVAGRGVDDPASVIDLADRLQWPVIADPRSGCRRPGLRSAAVVVHADAILRHPRFTEIKPSVVLRFGEPPSSKVVNSWLSLSGARHVVVSPSSAVHDPDRVIERQILADVGAFASRIDAGAGPRDWFDLWRRVTSISESVMGVEFGRSSLLSEPLAARTVATGMPEGSSLVVSSSMPIRDLEWFAADVVPTVYANRGANGIDGVISTAVGVALATKRPVGVLVGDVAFLHDSNALLGLVQRAVDVRVVVIDNDGGGIFSFLPQARSVDHVLFEQLWGTPHGVDVCALAAAHGVVTSDCGSTEDLALAVAQAGPNVIRVSTRRDENVEVHERLNGIVGRALGEVGP